MQLPNFIGCSSTAAAITAAADRTINAFEELVEPGVSGKGKTWLRKAPGLSVFASLAGAGVSPELFYQDNRAFAVCGDSFYELFISGSFVNHGTVATLPTITPTMCSNGTAGGQLFITSGLNGYIFDLNADTLTLIADADFPQGEAIAGEFMDGYFLVLIYQSRAFQISALLDGTDWDGLDIAERSEGSDDLVAIRRSHREIWLLGTKTGEVWYDNGDPDFPFAPVQGVFIEQGCARVAVLQRIGNTVMWVTLDEDGAGVVVLADGYTPTRVSTFSVEDMIQGSENTDLIAWTYQDRGHWFYNLHLNNHDTTPVYDLTMNRWDERGTWDEELEEWNPNRPISHVYAWGKHLVGDRLTGTVYEQSVDIFRQDLASV